VVRAAFDVYVPRMGLEPWPMRLDYAEVIGRGGTWVADEGGEVVGVLVLEPHDDHLLLDVVAVAPHLQGSGVGARLLALAEEEARRLGLDEVRLYTNVLMTENLSYYARHGYVETHRDQVNGFHRVFFTKQL
jgi:N-acetylglutamate synthase-like GNAT family acetyltransferase